MMPHLAEECWEVLGHTTFVAQSAWPIADRSLIVSNVVTYVAQVNGKKRGELTIDRAADAKAVERAALTLDGVLRALDNRPPRIENRVGHYLTEDLIADLNGTGETISQPKYRLTVKVSLGTQTPTVNSEINAASSATVTGEANFVLTKADGGAEVLKGTAVAAAAYDRTTQRFADQRAARDAEIRIARELSSIISMRLAAGLAAKSS